MIKIKLLEPHIHRNETTFRPFLFAQNQLKEIGIEFANGDSYNLNINLWGTNKKEQNTNLRSCKKIAQSV